MQSLSWSFCSYGVKVAMDGSDKTSFTEWNGGPGLACVLEFANLCSGILLVAFTVFTGIGSVIYVLR